MPQAKPQISQDLDGLLFRQDEVIAQDHALAVGNFAGDRHAVKTHRSIFSFAAPLQALDLLTLAVIREVVKIHRDLGQAITPQLL